MPPLPLLRPLPPQSFLRRPAWSAAAAAARPPCNPRRPCPAAAAPLRRSYSDFPTPDGARRPAATEQSNASTSHAQPTATRTKLAKPRLKRAKLPKPLNQEGNGVGAAAGAAASSSSRARTPAESTPGVKRRKPGREAQKQKKKKSSRPVEKPATVMKRLKKVDVDLEWKSMGDRPLDLKWRSVKGLGGQSRESGRLERLAQMVSPVRLVGGRAGGLRVGAITRDTIMDDATWQRLKQEVAQIGQEKPTAAEEVEVEVHEGLGEEQPDEKQNLEEKDLEEKDPEEKDPEEKDPEEKDPEEAEATVTYRPLQDLKARKPDPISVRERLRDAIGRMHSSLSAQIEDHPQPSRYRQNVEPATRSLHEQRLDELESLLVQASRRLNELKGYKPSGDDASPIISNVSPKTTRNRDIYEQDQTWKENPDSPVRAGVDGLVDTGKHPEDVAHPRRFLSRNPNRPLPHMTGTAIPAELYGPRKSPTSGVPNQQEGSDQEDGQSSLVEEVLGNVPEEHSAGNTDKFAKPSRDHTGSLVDEILKPTVTENQKQQAPLLSELFPELAHDSQNVQQPAPQERQVPKLSLDLQVQNFERRPELVERDEWTNKRMQALYVKDLVVVQLSGLSKNLAEADIRRLVPQSSKYIEGWSDPDFIKVIPVRDEETLERLDQYYVLFRNVRGARDFQKHVRELHVTTKRHSASSLLSALPHPPGFRDDHGVDIHAILQSYTLGPPASTSIYCSVVPYPYPRKLHQLLAQGGYGPIVGPANSLGASPDLSDADSIAQFSIAKVLLWFDGAQPSFNEVRKTIARDGKDRGLPWLVVGGTNSAEGVVRVNSNERKPVDNSGVRKVPSRYIVTLENKAEAQRFARRWQCSPFEFNAEGVYERAESPPKARTEVLW
ncbi:uncharacterized protein BKCO1_330001 [Diplodia corticola]|uniref:Uncharacterized protein n=1 Tax=Diplodia corticola TaxID=236234 RepID=A0A1J9QXH2_9PEZI|nr:uncharacterized protein BKCO1_330001 [Diplodia corticola]OJD33088.1 hypothetical protein BKCO1_330001 [Diplodia corticola]